MYKNSEWITNNDLFSIWYFNLRKKTKLSHTLLFLILELICKTNKQYKIDKNADDKLQGNKIFLTINIIKQFLI